MARKPGGDDVDTEGIDTEYHLVAHIIPACYLVLPDWLIRTLTKPVAILTVDSFDYIQMSGGYTYGIEHALAPCFLPYTAAENIFSGVGWSIPAGNALFHMACIELFNVLL